MKIVLAGGSGQVGTILARHFSTLKQDVVVLSRRAESDKPWRVVAWDGKTLGDWTKEIDGSDVVINLTGKTINCRYTAENRKQILETRVDSTRAIGEAIARASKKPSVWMNASAAGIYRHSIDTLFDETSTDFGSDDSTVPETWRFASRVCEVWEKTFFDFPTEGVRKIALRTTLVLSPDEGGVFTVLLGLVNKGLGGRQGDGRQSIAWMSDFDYAKAISFLIESEEIHGPVNLCTPQPVSNAEFMRALREAASVSMGLPAEAWMVKMGAVFLRTEPWLVLKSVRAVPGVLEREGFDFSYPTWTAAAQNLVRRWKNQRNKN